MAKKNVNPNAKQALNEMKLEIANELGMSSNYDADNGNKTAYENGVTGGKVGGAMSKKLVEMGELLLLDGYFKQ